MTRPKIHHARGYAGGPLLRNSAALNKQPITSRQKQRAIDPDELRELIERAIAQAVDAYMEGRHRNDDDDGTGADEDAMLGNARPVYTNERAYVPPRVLLAGKSQPAPITAAEHRAIYDSGGYTDEDAYVPPKVVTAPRRKTGSEGGPLVPHRGRHGRGRDAA